MRSICHNQQKNVLDLDLVLEDGPVPLPTCLTLASSGHFDVLIVDYSHICSEGVCT